MSSLSAAKEWPLRISCIHGICELLRDRRRRLRCGFLKSMHGNDCGTTTTMWSMVEIMISRFVAGWLHLLCPDNFCSTGVN